MKRPLALLALFYCLGIILSNLLRINFWVIMCIGLTIVFAANLLKKHDYIFFAFVLFATLLIGVLSLKNSCTLSNTHIVNFAYPGAWCSLSGFIDSFPEPKDKHIEFIFRLKEAQIEKYKWRCCGRVLVRTEVRQKLNYGDNLMLIGNLQPPPALVPIRGSYKNFLARKGIYLVMRVKDPRQIILKPGKRGNKLVGYSFWLRSKIEQVFSRFLKSVPAGILSAMVLGQKHNIPWLVNDSMVKAGTVHILVVSGFNVGIVAFMANLLFKIMRIPRRGRIILTLACLVIYCFLTGASNPVVRATIMGIIFLSAYLLKKQPDIYNSLSTAVVFILIINPQQVFDIGFQLSFASVFAIVCLYPKLKKLIRLDTCKIKIWRFFCEGLLVSFSAWLGTLWIIAYNFHIIAPVTVLANVFIVPLASIITLCGFTLAVFGLVCPALANLFSFPVSFLINLLLSLNAAIIKVPFAYFYL